MPSTEPLQLSPGKMKILKAVATLLEDPSAKLTVNRIANHISVTEAALYRHYRSKEDILQALLEYTESHFLAPLNYVQKQPHMTPATQLKYVYDHYMSFLDGHPGLARLLLGQGNTEAAGVSDKVKLLHAKLRSQLAMILKWAQAKGALSGDLTPDQVVELFYGTIMGSAMAMTCHLPQLSAEERWQAFAASAFAQHHQETQPKGVMSA